MHRLLLHLFFLFTHGGLAWWVRKTAGRKMSHDECVFLAFVLDSLRVKRLFVLLLVFWILAKTELRD
jgi:hypothetical protein